MGMNIALIAGVLAVGTLLGWGSWMQVHWNDKSHVVTPLATATPAVSQSN